MDFILFGIQGSGKGTQGKILTAKNIGAYFEMGGELRRLSSEDSELGKKVKSIIDAGHLVRQRLSWKSWKISPNDKNTGIIFDGIPRSKEQNDQFITLLESLDRPYMGIYFELSKPEAERRLLTRRMCTSCKTIIPRPTRRNSVKNVKDRS